MHQMGSSINGRNVPTSGMSRSTVNQVKLVASLWSHGKKGCQNFCMTLHLEMSGT